LTNCARPGDNRRDVRTKRFLELDRVGGRTAFLAFVLAFLGSAFAAGAHWIAVPHRVCDVHGTIEHGSEDVRDLAGQADALAARAHEGPIVRASGDEHEECSLGACARREALLPVHVDTAGRILPDPVGRVFVASDATPSVPLLLQAPSRSPPA
jgi:hypothetical protein